MVERQYRGLTITFSPRDTDQNEAMKRNMPTAIINTRDYLCANLNLTFNGPFSHRI